MDYKKMDDALVMAFDEVTVHTEPVYEVSLEIIDGLSVRMLTGTFSACAICDLSAQSWVERIKLCRKPKPPEVQSSVVWPQQEPGIDY